MMQRSKTVDTATSGTDPMDSRLVAEAILIAEMGLAVPNENITVGIGEMLSRYREFVHAEKVFLWSYAASSGELLLLHSDSSCQQSRIPAFALKTVPHDLQAFQWPFAVTPPLPRKILKMLLGPAASMLCVPLKAGGVLHGLLVAHASNLDDWSEELISYCQLPALALTGLLQRRAQNEVEEKLTERFSIAQQAVNDGLWDWDVEKGTLYVSPRWREILGYNDRDLLARGFDWRDIVHSDDLAAVNARLRRHLRGETDYFESIHRCRHSNGEYRWLLSRAKAIHSPDGHLRRIVGIELDITERKHYEQALICEKERALTTLESISEAVISTSPQGIIEYINPVAENLTGWTLAEASGTALTEVLTLADEKTGDSLNTLLARAHDPLDAMQIDVEALLECHNGRYLFVEVSAGPIRNSEGQVAGAVIVMRDVTHARELNHQLAWQASHDTLTGLINRREFEYRLVAALETAREDGIEHALCYLDLDQFKVINDTSGHAAGDSLLGQLGAVLESSVRPGDTVARLGGDEFGVLLLDCDVSVAMEIAERLREALNRFRFSWEGRLFKLGVSIGVVPLGPASEGLASVLMAADGACYAAKDSGRNKIHLFREDDRALRDRRKEMQWVNRINLAMEESRLKLYRQTIMPLDDRKQGKHFEILLRMEDEQGKLISPGQFIVAAERYSIMPNLDRRVVESIFHWLAENPNELAALHTCAINLSGQTLSDEQFLGVVVDKLQHYGIAASRICFEITETAAIANFGHATRFIHRLKELGCSFALDDFGSGASSFRYLKTLPVDYLKIDGSFIRAVLHDPIDREMVRSINEIGHLMGKQTIGEFAENLETIDVLRDIGIDYAQGFAVAPPEFVVSSLLPGTP